MVAPVGNVASRVRRVGNRLARIKMVPKVIYVPQFVYTEGETYIGGTAGNVTMEGRGMSEQNASVINSAFEAGLAMINVVGALFALIFNWRRRRVEREGEEERESLQEWRQQDVLPPNEIFGASGGPGRRVWKRKLSTRVHARHWQLELLN